MGQFLAKTARDLGVQILTNLTGSLRVTSCLYKKILTFRIKMRLQNLDELAIGRIERFLDPVSRLNFLIALKQNSRKPRPKPKKKKQHKYFCFFCALNVYYFDIAMQFGVGEENRCNIIFQMLNKFESRKVERGDDLNPYLITKYRRRHYSKEEDERGISNFMNYFGKFSKFN